MLERLFRLREHDTSVRTEVLGGVTTFAAMAYIIVVNPAILSFAGIPTGPGTIATILTAVFGCFLMAFYANRPYAVAPYMGENAFIAFGLAALRISWQQRLGAVFISGLVFLLLSLFGGREWLAKAISMSLRRAMAVGIGLFLAFIGLYDTGIVTGGGAGMPPAALTLPNGTLRAPDVPVKIGDFGDPKVLLAIAGFVVMAALVQRRVRGAILIGIVATAAVGALLHLGEGPKGIVAMPFQGDYTLGPLFMKMDLAGILKLSLLPVILTLLVMAFFDTTGTLVGLGAATGDEMADPRKPMVVDAVTCMFAAVVGTSTSGVFIESATGIREGARTGLATLVTGILFLISLFFLPLITPVQALGFAYGPALILVGLLMLPAARAIEFDDLTESVPAFATIAMMVFTYNIANGLTAGLILWPLMKLLAGRSREITAGSVVLAVLCLAYYGLGLRH
ncbi:NCS2 family permease [Fimbriimonas ginsengisoli]|uniref:Xanthine/uracil/vitamin C permease n=1 Tax=Fimbriimonas ginsengisoli Gsoil 348 TaxID=661478 RepID=A0A068NQ06_FIMGI|nr:NCS2 family permease [Fimbriimonas ginsengisoli]AIE85623.1 Xanthine/uracil/vitamin C permease [Fimbriimonas ginsengisoli Gsoil 348]